MHDVLLVANVLVSLVSGAFCLVAVIRPERLLGTDDGPAGPAARFYARFYALRQLPLSIVVVVPWSPGTSRRCPCCSPWQGWRRPVMPSSVSLAATWAWRSAPRRPRCCTWVRRGGGWAERLAPPHRRSALSLPTSPGCRRSPPQATSCTRTSPHVSRSGRPSRMTRPKHAAARRSQCSLSCGSPSAAPGTDETHAVTTRRRRGGAAHGRRGGDRVYCVP
jgi:hypothetical protein